MLFNGMVSVSGWHCPYWIFWRSHHSVFG